MKKIYIVLNLIAAFVVGLLILKVNPVLFQMDQTLSPRKSDPRYFSFPAYHTSVAPPATAANHEKESLSKCDLTLKDGTLIQLSPYRGKAHILFSTNEFLLVTQGFDLWFVSLDTNPHKIWSKRIGGRTRSVLITNHGLMGLAANRHGQFVYLLNMQGDLIASSNYFQNISAPLIQDRDTVAVCTRQLEAKTVAVQEKQITLQNATEASGLCGPR